MTTTYDTYGTCSDLKSAADRVSSVLGLKLVLHGSDYWGDYYATPLPDDTVEVISNGPDIDPEDMPYEEYKQYTVIVEVGETPYADEYRDKLIAAGFEHLDREVFADE